MTKIVVADGPKNATSDPDTGLRFYTWEGRELPSVTTIRRMAGMPIRLHQWTLSRVVHRALDHPWSLIRLLTRKERLDAEGRPTEDGLKRPRRPRRVVLDEIRKKEAGRWLRLAATEERDSAAALGTAVHDAAAKGIRGYELAPVRTIRSGHTDVVITAEQMRPRLAQFYDWLETSGATIIANERQVFNLAVGYAGTFDLLVVMPDGRIFLVDLKTGKGTYTEHALQLCAYSMTEFVGQDNVIDEGMTAWLHKVDGMAVLHLTDAGWRWLEVGATPQLWTAFQGLYAFAMFAYSHADIDDLLVAEDAGVAVTDLPPREEGL